MRYIVNINVTIEIITAVTMVIKINIPIHKMTLSSCIYDSWSTNAIHIFKSIRIIHHILHHKKKQL